MIIAALVIPIALGFTALAVEGGVWYADHHQLRNVADAAGLAAGWARHDGEDESDAALEAATGITGYNAGTDDVSVTTPPEAGPYAGDDLAIEVVVRRTRPVLLSHVFYNNPTVDIFARSVVRIAYTPGAKLCLLALGTTGTDYSGSGNGTVALDHCGVQLNSTSNGTFTESGNAHLTADWLHLGGTITLSGSASIASTETPQTGEAPVPDPYADLVFPGTGSCTATNYSVSGSTKATISPGRYCNGISASGNAALTLNPGTYIIDKGSFSISGSAKLTANGVTIVLTGSGANWASINISGGTNSTIIAPLSGAYAGMAIIKDRAATSGSASLSGGSNMTVRGAIYIPSHGITFSGGTGVGTGCTQIVAKSFTFSGGSNLGGNCTGYSLPAVGGGFADPKLVG